MSRKLLMRTRYNATAPGYDELYREEQYEKYRATLDILKGRETLCDIGCGTLLLAEFLSEQGIAGSLKYYVGLDLSPGMLEIALEKLRKGPLRELSHIVDVVEADAEHLPLRDRSCSLSVSYTVVDLVEDPGKMLREASRIAPKAVVTSLKKAHRMKGALPRFGVYLGETGKDYIFLVAAERGIAVSGARRGARQTRET